MSASNIHETRAAIRDLNIELRTFNKLAESGALSARDLLIALRALDLPPEIARAIRDMQLGIAAANTLRMTLKALYIEMGPLGWLILAGTTIGAIVAADFLTEVNSR